MNPRSKKKKESYYFPKYYDTYTKRTRRRIMDQNIQCLYLDSTPPIPKTQGNTFRKRPKNPTMRNKKVQKFFVGLQKLSKKLKKYFIETNIILLINYVW